MRTIILAVATLLAAMAPSYADALPTPPDGGILEISNQIGILLALTVSPSPCFNWGGGTTCAGATESMAVSGFSTLFSTGSLGTIEDMNGLGPVTQFETVPGGSAVGGATVNFDLTSLKVNGGTAIGNCGSDATFTSCTPADSPFTLTENSNGTQLEISFTALLNGYTGTSASGTTPYIGTFSMQDAGTFTGSGACAGGLTADITNFVNCEAAGGTIDSTWSATESPTPTSLGTPEPMSIALMGSMLLPLIPYLRRRKAQV
jgi:hypothetical protein